MTSYLTIESAIAQYLPALKASGFYTRIQISIVTYYSFVYQNLRETEISSLLSFTKIAILETLFAAEALVKGERAA